MPRYAHVPDEALGMVRAPSGCMPSVLCAHCRANALRRSHRRGIEKVLSKFGLFPFRCENCGTRSLRFRVGAGTYWHIRDDRGSSPLDVSKPQ